MEVAETPARTRLAALLQRAPVPLAEAALAVAEEEYPHLDTASYLRQLDALGLRVAARLGPDASPPGKLRALKAVLFEEAGFRPNEAEYYDPRNSFLNEVLDRRLGIPISLSMVYIEVAARVGLTIHGVGFPGHFLVKYASPAGGELFIDPYAGGDMLSAEDCAARFKQVSQGRAEFEPRFLEAAGVPQMLARMLHNLKKIYVEASDDVRALWVIDRLLMLHPGDLVERRDRGLVAARLGGTASALKDLSAYLAAAPGAHDAAAIAELVEDLRGRRSFVN
jgi:regulator of sirC expression with transglutaminase-like and TPR domain